MMDQKFESVMHTGQAHSQKQKAAQLMNWFFSFTHSVTINLTVHTILILDLGIRFVQSKKEIIIIKEKNRTNKQKEARKKKKIK